MDPTATEIYIWNDRARSAYVRLREHENHWRVEWGRRDPPGGEEEVELGRHVTSDPADALEYTVARIRALSDDPADATHAEEVLRESLGLRAGEE